MLMDVLEEHAAASALKLEEALSSETSVCICHIPWRHIPEDSALQMEVAERFLPVHSDALNL
jgi:hypothetical protein